MTRRILKLSTATAVAAALLISSFDAGAEARVVSKPVPSEAKSLPDTAKSPPATTKSTPPAPELATKPEERSGLCFGRLIEMLRSRTAA
jgi:hypothetical protein